MLVNHVDLDVLGRLRDVMEGGYPSLLEVFIKDSQQRVTQLSGLVRDPLFSTASPDQLKRLGEMAHSFKGSSGNMGAAQLTELCCQLEALGRTPSTDSAILARQLVQAIEDEFHIVRGLFEVELQSVRIGD